MKALIFGISGQDGAYLARLLLAKGYEVHGTSRDAEMSPFASLAAFGIRDRISLHSVVLTDFRSTFKSISSIRPDEIYNLAGQSSVGMSYQQPVETLESIATGTLNILEAIRLIGGGIRFYNAGSSECFGDTNGLAADENTPFQPKSPYAVAKSAAFWEIASYRDSYGIYACSGILFNHESVLRPARFVTRKIAMAAARIAAGDTAPLALGDLSVRRDWGLAPEYVEPMWMMLQQEAPEDFVIATGHLSGLEDFVACAFAALGLDWREHVRQDDSLLRPSEIRSGFGRPDKAGTRLGWAARTHMPEIAALMARAELARLKGEALSKFLC
jgi:GDPmannose 4,6-dehydratase